MLLHRCACYMLLSLQRNSLSVQHPMILLRQERVVITWQLQWRVTYMPGSMLCSGRVPVVLLQEPPILLPCMEAYTSPFGTSLLDESRALGCEQYQSGFSNVH